MTDATWLPTHTQQVDTQLAALRERITGTTTQPWRDKAEEEATDSRAEDRADPYHGWSERELDDLGDRRAG